MRNYSSKLFRDRILQEEFEQEGFVVLDVFSPSDVVEMMTTYRSFLELTDPTRFAHLAASCGVPEKEAKRIAKDGLDSICHKRFKTVFDDASTDFIAGTFLIKTAGSRTKENILHQDLPMVDESTTYGIYSWTPITPTNKDSGRLFIVPRSHTLGTRQRTGPVSFNLTDDGLTAVGLSRIVLNVEIGQTVFFDTALIHGSLSNLSQQDRVAVNYFVKPIEAQYLYFGQNSENPSAVDVYEIDKDFYYYNQLDPLGSQPNKNELKYLRTELKITQPLAEVRN